MKVLILGGTGAMGKHLVHCLDNGQNEIYVTSRSPYENRGNIYYLQGNAKKLDFLKSITQTQYDCIIDFMTYETAELKERVDVLVKSTVQYIFLSSCRVYSPTENLINEKSGRLLDETKDVNYLKTNEYALEKARQEDVLFSCGYRNWTIIRPYITYSEIRMQLGIMEKEAWLYRACHGRSIVFSEDIIDNVTTLSYGADVAKYISKVVGNKETLGEVFNIVPADCCTWRDILSVYISTIERVTGSKPNVILKKSIYNMGYPKPIYQVEYDRATNRRFDNSKINSIVKVEDITSAQTGLEKCLEDFLERPVFRKIDWRQQALADRFVNESAKLSEMNVLKDKLRYIMYRYTPLFRIKGIIKWILCKG